MGFFFRVGALALALCSVSCSTDFKQIGNACFCRADTKDTARDCDCDAMSALSAVYLGRGLEPAASIVMYDPDDDPSFVCLFEDVSVGQEMECLAGSVGHFSEQIFFSIESGDGEICEGTLDTSCSSQLLDSKGENEAGEGCDALRFVVTGYVGDDGRVCDDGYAPCDCDAATVQQSKEPKHDGAEETESHSHSHSNSDSADLDADSQSDDEDGERDSHDETSTTSWSEPWTSSTTTTSTTTTTTSIDTDTDTSKESNADNADNDWALRLSQYVHSMKNSDTDSELSTTPSTSMSDSSDESSEDSSASDDSQSSSDSQSDSQFMTTAASSDSSSDDDDDESASSNSNSSGQSSSSSDLNGDSNEDDDDDMYDDDDKDDDDDSIDESYDDDSESSGGTTDNASESQSDSDGSSSQSSQSESEVVSEYEIVDSNSEELDSEIGDSDDAAYTDSFGDSDSDSQIESDSDSNAIATGTFGLITRLAEGGFGRGIAIETTTDDSYSAGYAADVGSFAAAPNAMWTESTDTTPYEKYSFYTLVAILLLNVTAFGWCLCMRARTGKRTQRKSLDGVEYAQGKLTAKIEIMEEAADDTEDDETEEEEENEVFTD